MLPELVGKWYTRKHVADSEGVVSEPPSSSTGAIVEDRKTMRSCTKFRSNDQL